MHSTQVKIPVNDAMATESQPPPMSLYDFFTDVANMLKAFIGLNFMIVAYAFSKAGMTRGIIGLIVITIITEHCCLLLVDIKESMYQPLLSHPLESEDEEEEEDNKDPEADHSISMQPTHAPHSILPDSEANPTQPAHPPSYGDIAFHAGGRTAETIINFALVLTQFGYCVGYLIFVSQTMHDVLVSATPVAWFILFPLPIVATLGLLKSIRLLGPFSIFANGALLCGFAAVVTFICNHFSWTPPKVPLTSFPLFFGQMTAALEGIGLIVPVQSSMANRDKFPVVLRITLVILTIILMVVGVLGFATFGADTRSIILLNFGQSPVVVAVKAVLIIGILFTYPLQIIPVFEFAERQFMPARPESDARNDNNDPNLRHNRSSQFQIDDSELDTDVDIEESNLTNNNNNNNNTNNNDNNNNALRNDHTNAGDSGSGHVGAPVEHHMFLHERRRIAIRLSVVASTAIVAVLAGASFGVFLSLVGSMGASVLAYTAPALFHNLAFRDRLSRFTKMKNGAIVAFGLLGGVAGTIASLWEMIEIHRGNSSPA